jgi:predicted Zn-dependent protease
MTTRTLAIIALSAALASGLGITTLPRRPAQDDAVLAALDAELDRSFAGLGASGERAPYFLGYAVWDRRENVLTAGAGSILVDRDIHQRVLDVDVRVGDYRLDNTRRFTGRGGVPAGGGAGLIPFGDDVDAMRAAIWHLTEREYRAAVERIGQVEANRAAAVAAADTSGDFSREEATTRIEEVPPAAPLDRSVWSERLRRVSARFQDHPDINNAVVTLRSSREVRYLVTSEGTRVRTGDTGIRITITADTRAEDGMDLNLSRSFDVVTPADLPSEAALLATVDSIVQHLDALRAAPVIEPFSGPAILSGRASAVFFHEIFGHRIEGHRQKDESFAQTFTNRLGESVLPAFLSITDDPTRREIDGITLAGHYAIDDEGIPARPVSLIENGVLSGFLMSRSPIAAAPTSNGHGRRQPGTLAVARQGNLFVTSTSTVSPAELRAQLVAEIQRQGKPYGYRFDEVQGGFTGTARITPQSFKVLPLLVYRVHPDGRPDELVRGADIVGTPLTVFGKILATDNQPEVFNGTCVAESGSLPVSAVSPGVLIQELEVEKRATSQQRPPILAPPATSGRGADDEAIFSALGDELQRSMDSLRIEGLERPHFIAYRVEDATALTIDATFGGIVAQNQVRTRRLEADVRVGSPQADNTNFLDGPGALGWVEIGFDDSYDAIRRFAWRITDARYRLAAEKLGRKTAALERRPAPDVPSFTPVEPQTIVEPPATLVIEEAAWSDLARRVSAVFRDYPAIEDSRARVQVQHLNRYFVSSEGTRARTPETTYLVLISAIARGPGGTIRDYRVFAAPSASDLGAADAIVAAARELADAVTARVAAESIASYTGPVLFEGTAAPQFFHALLGRYLAGTPAPASPTRASPPHRLVDQVGQRVMPAGFTVTDDPTRTEFAGTRLLGHYRLDGEGVPPQAVRAVEDGTLRAFLQSRIPAKAGDRSTGHGRDSGTGEMRAMTGSLIVETAAPLPADRLRAELLRLVQERGLEFGLIVRGIEDVGMLPGRPGATRTPALELPPPVAVYKRFPDGREEPVRDIDFSEATMRALRDIAAAGEPAVVYNFMQGGAGFLRLGSTPISVVAPPVLVSELGLRRSESTEKGPVLGHPFFPRR